MKKLFIIVCMLVYFVIAYSNPAYPDPGIISELWFTESGHMMVEFYKEQFYGATQGELFIPSEALYGIIWYKLGLYEFGTVRVVDITELCPGYACNPYGGTLKIGIELQYSGIWMGVDRVTWGNDFECDVNAIQPGQSIAHASYEADIDYWGEMTDYTWTKDEPPTPGTNPYSPIARSVLKVRITSQDNEPISNVRCYSSPLEYTGFTDSNGEYTCEVLPGKVWVSAVHPLTGNPVLAQNYYWVEPYDTLNVLIAIDMPMNFSYEVYRGFQVFPNPSNNKQTERISFRYYGDKEITYPSYVRLYDVKGRFVQSIHVYNSGFGYWVLPDDVVSGVYIAKLIIGNKYIDTIKFSIEK